MMGSGGTLIVAAVRAFIAVFIIFSLTLAPFTAAQAMKVAPMNVDMSHAHSAMSDCHKAKHQNVSHDHACCGDHAKSSCPDQGCACVFKCGAQSLAISGTHETPRFASIEDFHALNAAKPPGVDLMPAAPPPRA
jgi:hypothetical protein